MSPSRSLPFVILEHDHPFVHWDLLMQQGGSLKAWRLLQPVATGVWLPAQTLPDHRTLYLTYEGPVRGDRGSVKRITGGQYATAKLGTGWNSPENNGEIRTFRLSDCDFAQTAYYRCVVAEVTPSSCLMGEHPTNYVKSDGDWYFE